MAQKITQIQAVLMYLEEKGSITHLEAQQELGIMRLASRIVDLKKMGYKFTCTTEKVSARYGGTTRITRYSLREET